MIARTNNRPFAEFLSAFSAETLKLAHSKVAWATVLASSLVAAISGLFMFILENPDRARSLGLVGAKAQIFGGTADWTSLFNLAFLMTGIAGLVVFGIVYTWVIGREFTDKTVFEWLSVPVSRVVTVLAKLSVATVWSLALVCLSFVLIVAVGWILQLPGWSDDVVSRGFVILLTTGLLSAAVCVPFAFIAGLARGYLVALGAIFLALLLGQVASQLGYGQFFPWMIPMFFSGAAETLTGQTAAPLGFASYLVVAITFTAGLIATVLWWKYADQS